MSGDWQDSPSTKTENETEATAQSETASLEALVAKFPQAILEEPVQSKLSNALPLWGNKETMNLNSLILDNIKNSPYFKTQMFQLKTYHEVLDEVYYKVVHLEPWERGSRKFVGSGGSRAMEVRGVSMGGIVSTAYCVLYKLFTLKLSRKQVYGMLNHTDSPYIRALGFMYLRYTQPPDTLWSWYEPYLDDEEEVDPKDGGGDTMTIGQMLKLFLTKLDWYATLFPRIPVPAQKSIEHEMRERNKRKLEEARSARAEYGGDYEETEVENVRNTPAAEPARSKTGQKTQPRSPLDKSRRSQGRDGCSSREKDASRFARNRRSRSRDKKRSRSREKKRSRSREKRRSRSREKRRSRSRDKKRSRSRDKKRSRSRGRNRSRSRDKKRSKSREKRRSRSREKERRSPERNRDAKKDQSYPEGSKDRKRKRSRSKERKSKKSKSKKDRKHRSRSRSTEKDKKKSGGSKHKKKAKSKSPAPKEEIENHLFSKDEASKGSPSKEPQCETEQNGVTLGENGRNSREASVTEPVVHNSTDNKESIPSGGTAQHDSA